MAARKPADHQEKQTEPKVTKVAGGHRVEYLGASAVVRDEALDDYEMLDELVRMQNGDGTIVPSLLKRLLGDDYQAVLDGLRDPESKRVKLTEVTAFLMAVLGTINPNS